jgi:hypothetical protein
LGHGKGNNWGGGWRGGKEPRGRITVAGIKTGRGGHRRQICKFKKYIIQLNRL